MTTWLFGSAILSLFVWIGLILFWGRFWWADQRLLPAPARDPGRKWPDVVAVIPARNEAPTIGRTVSSLLAQAYPGKLEVIVVDDNSEDGTGDIVRRAAAAAKASRRVHLVEGAPLAVGWSGKLWAVEQGIAAAGKIAPRARYVLLTDADIEHDADNLRGLVAKAEAENRDLVSLMVRLNCQTFWERLLIPAFVFFFQKLYPFPWVNDPTRRLAAAAGGCMLVRRQALAAAGGISAIRGRLIDDCALAALIKRGGSIWLGLATKTRSLRRYTRLTEVWDMVARTAYEQLGRQPLAVAGAALGMAVLYVAPPLAAVVGLVAGQGDLLALGLGGWALMVLAYWPTLRRYGRPVWVGAALPVAGLLYALMTVDSGLRHWRGRGGAWKGRTYGAGPGQDAGPGLGQGGGDALPPMLSMDPMNATSTATDFDSEAPGASDLAMRRAEEVVRASGSTFFWAMRVMAPEKRRAMFAVYAFCRIVDDIADEPNPLDQKHRELARWRREIELLFAGDHGQLSDPVAVALIEPVARFGLRRVDFLAVIDGMETDAAETLRLETRDDLLRYCDRVACAVGRLCCGVFGIERRAGDELAASLGLALQLTNILRDLTEDAARDRLYLPADLLVAHGISANDPGAVLGEPGLAGAAREIGVLAAQNFAEARWVIARCDRAKVKPAVMMMEAYERIFTRIQDRGWGRVTEPAGLSKAEKLWIAFRYGLL